MKSLVEHPSSFLYDNGPVFDIDPIGAVIIPDLFNAKGSTGGLKGKEGSAYEGGIRCPHLCCRKKI